MSGEEPETAAHALAELCRRYWQPVYHFVRRGGRSPEDAEDLTQGFFARMIEGDRLARARADRGRFRNYLLASLKHYLEDERRKGTAAKRGGEVQMEMLERPEEEESVDPHDPEFVFARQWAEALLVAVRDSLRKECAARGKEAFFDSLEPYLPWNASATPQGVVAEQLGMKLSTLRAEIFSMRRRYAQILRETIAETVSTAEEVDDEIRFLKGLFSQ